MQVVYRCDNVKHSTRPGGNAPLFRDETFAVRPEIARFRSRNDPSPRPRPKRGDRNL